jgi:ATP-dependent Lon protease
MLNFKTTAELPVSKKVSDQIIGQDTGLQLIKKAAQHRRHVLLIGNPGTGKSLLGQALAELLPTAGELQDVLCYPNEKDPNNPLIKSFPAEEGEKNIIKLRNKLETNVSSRRFYLFLFGGSFLFFLGYFLWSTFKSSPYGPIAIVQGVSTVIWILFIGFLLLSRAPGMLKSLTGLAMIPKSLVLHKKNDTAPFVDATGSHSGALLGDVLHDPLQSGGLGTPPHERLVPGMVHRANGGVLFLDEVAILTPKSQQELLTILQEKKYPITGQSEHSSGAMTRSEPVPADFVLVAAGNEETIAKMHPALRSRIRGYGYEIHMNHDMPDTSENKFKIAQFVAQEVIKDRKIPHFSKAAVEEIINEAKRRSGRSEKLTLHLRELGGLIRAAGDLAKEENKSLTEKIHVLRAKSLARPLEQQIADKYIEEKKKYEVIITKGKLIGRVNGLAVIGTHTSLSGIVLPIESEVVPGGSKGTEIVATGQLGKIAQEAVKNVSAIIRKYFGKDLKEKNDVFCQFIGTTEGVEGDSASIAVATAIVSAFTKAPVRQDFAMTGSLSIRGEVLAVGGVTQKAEAAIEASITHLIVPKANEKDIILPQIKKAKIKIIPVSRIEQVLKQALDWKGKEKILKKLK